ncbi:MAG: DinB family protein [Bacteroidota bacterium]
MPCAQIKNELFRCAELIQAIDSADYSKSLPALSGASIGAHMRHIIELFQCLNNGYVQGVVNYDNRERNDLIQTVREIGLDAFKNVILELEMDDKPMKLVIVTNGRIQELDTTYFRELWFNFDHCIHHEALIRIGLKELGKEDLVATEFGVSPSTIAYQNQFQA